MLLLRATKWNTLFLLLWKKGDDQLPHTIAEISTENQVSIMIALRLILDLISPDSGLLVVYDLSHLLLATGGPKRVLSLNDVGTYAT